MVKYQCLVWAGAWSEKQLGHTACNLIAGVFLPSSLPFAGRTAGIAAPFKPVTRSSRVPSRNLQCDAASLQFVRGVDEPSVPEVRLMRSRTGGNGSAMFIFDNPSIFQASSNMGEITGLFMVDDEVCMAELKLSGYVLQPPMCALLCSHA
jgi:hypothetical protein